jgi:hypothetical protein
MLHNYIHPLKAITERQKASVSANRQKVPDIGEYYVFLTYKYVFT